MEMTNDEKALINYLASLPDKKRNEYIRSHPEIRKEIREIFNDEEKSHEMEQASDSELRKAILSSYAAKGYEDEGRGIKKRIFYIKKTNHLKNKSSLDQIITSNIDSNVGEKRNPEEDKKGGFNAYIFSDSKGKQPGFHCNREIKEVNTHKIGDAPNITSARYLGFKNSDELKAAALQMADSGLLENYFGDLCGINESEFMDDFIAMYGDDLNESLSCELSAKECKSIFNLPLKKLMTYTNTEIRADIKDKDNGKDLDDYKINNGDAGLTLNYMLAYIRRLGKNKEKDFIEAKLKYFMKIQDDAQDDKKTSFKIPFGTVNSVYRRFLKYKNAK